LTKEIKNNKMMKMFKGVKSLAVALLLAGSTTNA